MEKMSRKRMKNNQTKCMGRNNGITLIALMITVIVLLILAGVTLSLTLGERGIFKTAKGARQNYLNAQAEEEKALSEFDKEIDRILGNGQTKWGENIKSYKDREGNTIPVPVGFEPILDSEGQGTKNTGFVIRDTSTNADGTPTDTYGNEFVWIPCTIDGVGGSIKYDRYAFTRTDWDYKQTEKGTDEETNSEKIEVTYYDETYYYTEAMPQDEKTSIATYGGYYIGRYEAGIENGGTLSTSDMVDSYTAPNTTWTGYTGGKLVIKSGQQVWNYITRDRAQMEASRLYNKEKNNVTSKLCSSYGWDTALKFIEKQNSTYPTYSDGDYYEQSSITITGNNNVTPRCNIYDMGGNVGEWTTESCSGGSVPCTLRGGFYDYTASYYPAANRDRGSTTNAVGFIGFRVTLYM